MNTLMYFVYIFTIILLVYSFIATILFSFEKKLLTTNIHIQTIQKWSLVVILFALMLFFCKSKTIPAKFYITPWIWGFLTSHLFIYRKKPWIHELLGLGILVAITIVLFFKQEEIIKVVTKHSLETVSIEIAVIYITAGLLFGVVFWPKIKH
ncbi:hypothetical protein [uncultured Kordia sp.]|uniref:hypothetical protein n=1 Tax=uncultured Kordia sp. TaxID=507699 RepID=UPI0026210F17|nr:hypothetical protein [uncultured Kordia sp.]